MFDVAISKYPGFQPFQIIRIPIMLSRLTLQNLVTTRAQMLALLFGCGMSVLSACKDNRDSSTIPSGNSGNSSSSVGLQRVFQHITMQYPVLALQAPDDDSAWYIVEKTGRVLRVSNDAGTAPATVFVDISDRVNADPNEAGLLGMAFHPGYSDNGQVYLSYTANGSTLSSVISRFRRNAGEASVNPASEEILLQVNQPYSNHNGGHIAFGPDGFLYIGLGDGGSGGDPQGNGQNTQTLLGALLRIDVNSGSPYSIPATNPFANGAQGRPEIYAWGLRNPWRWSFDRADGKLWVADVGQNSWEEVDLITAPGNFGWNVKEGSHCYQSTQCDNPSYIDPVVEYSHDQGCSITGGYVYRGSAISSLQGTYLYSDFCSGTLWGARDNGNGGYSTFQILSTGLNVSSFAEGNDGEIYLLHLDGEMHQLVAR